MSLIVDSRNKTSDISYNVPGIERHMLSADQILTRWNDDRRNISRKVAKMLSPTKDNYIWNSLFPASSICTCNGDGITSKSGICMGCSITSRFFDKGVFTLNSPITVQIGKYVGMEFIVTSENIVKGSHQFSPYVSTPSVKDFGQEVIRDYSMMQACEENFSHNVQRSNFYACKGSYNEHYKVVSSIMEYEMDKINIPCKPVFLWTWACMNKMFTVTQLPNLGLATFKGVSSMKDYTQSPLTPTAKAVPYDPLNTHTIKGLLGQLFSSLHFLTGYTFTHGIPSIQYLGFEREIASYKYGGVDIVSPLTLRIIPSGVSSISMTTPEGGVNRIYHPGVEGYTPFGIEDLPTIEVKPYLSKTVPSVCPIGLNQRITPCMPEYLMNKITCYKIGSNTKRFSHMVKHLGIPLFASSYDLYGFLCCLMCEESFYHAVLNDQKLLDLWKSLWIEDEFNSLSNDLHELRIKEMPPTSLELLDVLCKYNLRCDAIKHSWEQFSQILRDEK